MLWFIIPIYNEAENLPLLLESLKNATVDKEWHAVFINDGSNDNTIQVLENATKQFPITILNHPENSGVHQAFLTGFSHTLSVGKEKDIVVTLEGDNTSDLSIFPSMLHNLSNGDDVVLASCYANGGGIKGSSIHRIIISELANWLIRVCFPIMRNFHTLSSFFRAYHFEALQKAFKHYNGNLIEEEGFVCMVELLVKFLAMELNVSEVPMILDTNKRCGKSKMKVMKTAWRYLHFIVKNIGRYRHIYLPR